MTRHWVHRLVDGMVCALLAMSFATPAGADVKHPNLLLNRQEIDQIKVKVRDHKWAADLLDQVKTLADGGGRI
jgi:hypothetical protein